MTTTRTTLRSSSPRGLRACLGRLMTGSAALLLASTAGYGMEWPVPDPIQQKVDRIISIIQDLSSGLEAPPSSLADLAFELEFDYDAAIAHVAETIAFEPYSGVLRGPEGTHRVGAGNSWDQAVLLAGLLKSMGADAQVVVGRIPPPDARRLLQRSFDARPAENGEAMDPSALVERASDYDAHLGELMAAQIDAWAQNEPEVSIEDETARLTESLARLLDGSGRRVPQSAPIVDLVERLAVDYAWTRWRIGPGDPWVDLHPAFGTAAAPAAEAERYLDAEIPPEYQHRAAFQLFAERGLPGNVERIAVMSRFERPVAQLYKNPVELGMVPLRMDPSTSQTFLVPQLNGSLAPGGQAINELGLTAPPEDAATGPGQFIATVSSKMGDALGGLAGADSEAGEEAVPRLQGLILVVETIAPGGDGRIIERRMVDLRDWPEAEFPSDAAFGLVMRVDVGSEPEAVLGRQALDQHETLTRALPSVLAMARGKLSYEEARRLPEYRALSSDVWLDFDLFSDAFLPAPTSDRLVYRPGPLLATRRTWTDRERGTITATDILSNPSRVLVRRGDAGIEFDPSASLRQGVRETLFESELTPGSAGWADRAPADLVTATAGLDALGADREWPAAAREAAQRDLDRGYVLAVADTAEAHWWRVDPETGETLGMGTHGGQEIVEYLVMVTGAAMSTYLFAKSVESCDEAYPDNQQMADCCIVGNLLVTYAQAAAGGAAGGLPNGSAMAYAEHPWAASLGYFMASVQFDLSINLAVGAITEQPIEYVCQNYVID